MKKYRIQVDYGEKGYEIHGGIFRAILEFIKTIDSGAFVKVTKLK